MAALNEQEEFEFRLRAEREGQTRPMEHTRSSGQGMVAGQDALKQTLAEEGWAGRNLAGFGSALAKPYYGVKQLVKGGTLSHEDQQAVKDWNTIEQEAPVGAIGGNLGMMYLGGKGLSAVPGMSTAGRAIMSPQTAFQAGTVGAGYMGIQPTEKQGMEGMQERGIETLKGAALGAGGYGAVKGVSRVLSPQTSPEIQALMKEGVTPTPGQIMGGGFKKAEEAARSVPIIGDAITSAQRKGVEQFNRAAINRALNPIGKSIGANEPVGYKAIDAAHNTISQAYDDLLPKLNIKIDNQFTSDIKSLKGMSANMLPERAKQFDNILKSSVIDKFTKQGKMHPNTMKEVEGQLGQMASKASKSLDLDQQQLGAALREVQTSLRGMVERGNPQYAGQLQKVNSAYANLLRVENAASRQGAKEGIFTPNQLEAATRAMDSSLRKSSSARGKALMQDLATVGDVGIANKLPDSGTPYRLAVGGAGLASGAINPMIPAALIGGSALYTQPAQKALAYLLTQRPDLLRLMGSKASQLAPYGGLLAIGAGQ